MWRRSVGVVQRWPYLVVAPDAMIPDISWGVNRRPRPFTISCLPLRAVSENRFPSRQPWSLSWASRPASLFPVAADCGAVNAWLLSY